MLLSFILPGLGQLYKGQFFNAIAWFVAVVVGYILFIIPGLVLHLCCIIGAGMGDPYR
jgi:TM2 domain-containing membrane protein YozV